VSTVGLRYGYVTNGLVGHRLDEALRMLAECGYDGVALTLDPAHLDPLAPDVRSRAAEVRALLEARGLDCVVETGARFVLDPWRKHYPSLVTEGREQRIELLRRAIVVAADLGSPVVSLWSGTAPAGLDPRLAWDRLRDGCERVLADAERHGVRLGFEPEPGMMVDRVSAFEALARDLGDPESLGLTLDLGHCVCLEPDPVAECVRRVAPRLAHVHADDMRRGVHEHLMFGQGELDLEAALGSLAREGYEGLVAVELSRHAHAAHVTVPRSIEILRAAERRARAGSATVGATG
jgi:sugar phosphate isomerase/epimerase